MATVLLVEDDAAVRELLSLVLADEHFHVVTAASGSEAIDRWHDVGPDLVLLDLMLPGADGLTVCRAIRRTSDVPIIMLTAKTDPVDVIVGLEAGADDYVTKPFEARVLLARIRAVLRRLHPDGVAEGGTIVLGGLVIDRTAVRVTRHGEPLELSPTEYKLLLVLAENAGRVLSRDALLRLVWDYDYLGDSRLVDVGVARLRSKVEDDPTHPALIQTRRGFGYCLVHPAGS